MTEEKPKPKHSLRPDTITDVLDTYAMHYQCTEDVDAKADITDNVKDFLCGLAIDNKAYNHYIDYYNWRKQE